MNQTTVLGIYKSGGRAAEAIAAIRHAQLGVVHAYSPTADTAILGARPRRTSQVRLFTLLGGILGCVIGVAFPAYTMTDWPLIVGGKPLLSLPPLVIIGFELMILGAALSGLVGFLLLSGLPHLRGEPLVDRRFTNDLFGVLVTCMTERRSEVRAHLEHAGATEVINGG